MPTNVTPQNDFTYFILHKINPSQKLKDVWKLLNKNMNVELWQKLLEFLAKHKEISIDFSSAVMVSLNVFLLNTDKGDKNEP